jgi:glucoamylase
MMAQRLPIGLRLLVGIAVLLAMVLVGTTAGPKAGGAAPAEAPKPADPAAAVWTEADKDGFGTSTTPSSKVWYTIDDGALTEVYFPDLGTPSVRDLQFIVSDGKTFAELETEATDHQVQLVDGRALVYRQINTKPNTYRITKTYVTDPDRSTVLVDVKFESLTRKPYQLYVLYDPSLDNGGTDDSATSEGARLLASDVDATSGGDISSALVGSPGFAQVSSGHLGMSDGWTDLKEDYKMDWDYRSALDGNVVQTAKTTLSGLPNNQRLTLSLGFDESSTENALQAA